MQTGPREAGGGPDPLKLQYSTSGRPPSTVSDPPRPKGGTPTHATSRPTLRALTAGAASFLSEKTFLGKFALGILTQSLLSLTNLLIRIWLARVLPKEQYGLYSIGFETIFVFLSVQNALVNSPLAVLLPERQGERREMLLGGLGAGQWLIFGPLTALFAAGLLLVGGLYGMQRVLWLLPLVLAVPAAWWREFQRVVQYNRFELGRVLLLDVLFSAGALGGIALLAAARRVSVGGALAALGAAYLFSAAAGRRLGGERCRFRLDWIRETFRETWAFSRWSLLGIAAAAVQLHGYVYLVSLLDGLESTADISAARVFLMPFALLINSSQRIFLAKGSQIRSGGDLPRYRSFLAAFFLFFVGAWLLYVAALFLLKEPLIRLVFTERYRSSERYLLGWAVLFLFTTCRIVVTNSLIVYKEFRFLALNGVASAAAVLACSVAFLRLFGPVGVILALSVGELILLFPSLSRLLASLRPRKAEPHDPQAP